MPRSPNVGHYPFPFKHIPDISAEASRQIRRNFEALLNIPSSSQFDAIIDPTLPSSDVANHRYKNMGDLALSESWPTTHTFKVGVKNQADVAITDSGTVDISANGDLALFGLGQPLADASHVVWNWKTLFCASTQQVYLYNLSIGGGFSTTIANSNAILVAESCYFDSNITSPVASGVATAFFAKDCYFDGNVAHSSSLGHAQTHYYFDCILTGSLTIGSNVTTTVQGGTIGTAGGKTLTITGSGSAYVDSAVLANLTIDAAGSNNIVIVNSALGGNVSVSATVPSVSVTGDWAAVSFTGTPAALRRFQGSGNSLDFAGPGQATHTNHATGSGNNVKLRGAGVQAFIEIIAGQFIEGLSLVDSLIVGEFGAAASFSLDASSLRNLCILGGTHQAGWGGTTNSGGPSNRIITELDDSLVSGSNSTIVNLIQSIAGAGTSDTSPDYQGVEYVAGPPGIDGKPGTNGAQGIPGPPTDVWETTPDYFGPEYIAGPPGRDGVNGAPGPYVSFPGPLEDYEVADMVQRIVGDPPGPTLYPSSTVLPGTILATTQYAPAGLATFTFPLTTMAALDTTNLTITFVAPRNGIVDIVVTGLCQNIPSATVATSAFLALFDHTSHAVVGNVEVLLSQPSDNVTLSFYYCMKFHLTGLAEGSHTLDLAGGSTTGAGTVTTYAQAASSKTVASDSSGPLIIQAIASI